MPSTSSPVEPPRPRPGHAPRGTLAGLFVIGIAAVALIVFSPSGRVAHAGIDRCAAPEEITAVEAPLPHLAHRLLRGGTLTIVALGSSSTAGVGATRPGNSYPSRLAIALAHLYPRLKIRVVNRGVGGEEAGAMAIRIQRDVLPEKPDLVIWQVGTNAVLRDQDPLGVMAVVRLGIRQIKAAGSDVMLMNLQYAPAVLQHAGYHEMLRVLAAAANAEHVPMFRRFRMMREWAEDGRMPLRTMVARDRLHMTDASYDCLAREVGASIGGVGRAAAEAATTLKAAPQA